LKIRNQPGKWFFSVTAYEAETLEMAIIDIVRRSELFLGLDDVDIQKIVDLPSCQEVEYDDGEAIFSAGDKAEHLYILEEGRVSLVLRLPSDSSAEARHKQWRTITRGGIFGWSALVPPHLRIGSAISVGRSTIVSISGSELQDLFNKDTSFGYLVMKCLVKVIASRVWNIEGLLSTGKKSPFI
jgi:CRP-like cAMP-binding protein